MDDTTTTSGQIARSATLVSLGNVLSRVMGLVRETVIANLFGASGAVSAYRAAQQVPLTLYEMLVGGMVSSALVPTFSEYAARERLDELWRIASLLFTLVALALGAVVLILELGAPLLAAALVHFDAPLQEVTVRLLRIVLLAVFFLGMSGMATALCHALQRFALPAFTTALFNASIVVFALVLGGRWIREVEQPTINDVLVGDVVAGRAIEEQDGALLARSIAVAPAQMVEGHVLGTVTAIEGRTLTVDDGGQAVRIRTDEHTLFSVKRRQVRVLAIGLVVGAVLQVLLQLPALRDMRFRPALDLRHPALRRILRLYLPVVFSLVVAGLGVLIDRNLASRTGELSISWMGYATTLREFPLGLVSMAIATATLPALARQAAAQGDGADGARSSERFRATLASGLRLVLALTLPAAMGLLVLARPLVALLFQHGEFGAHDTAQTALALRYYLIGMLCAAIDQPLVFAFYARQDTWRPALVGILGVGLYLIVALPAMRPLGMVGLILANDAQLGGHMAIMIWLLHRQVGTLRGYGIEQTLFKSTLASAIMGGAVYGVMRGAAYLVPVAGRMRWALTVGVGGGVGLLVYLVACALLNLPELALARTLVGQVIQKRRGKEKREQ